MSESSERPSGSSRRPSALLLGAWLTLALLTGNSRAKDPPTTLPAGTYAEAMKWLDGKLTTVANDRPLLIVWLLDGSKSMADDRHETARIMHTLYESLGDKSETAVVSFGARVRKMTSKPETSLARIRNAFDRVPFDETGQENMCMAVNFVVKELAPTAKTNQQQMVIITLTDESPSDSDDTMSEPGQLEQTIQRCRKAKVPVYVLGREAIFGLPYATIRWKDPVYQLNHWVPINRGPDTAFPERLRWTGLGAARDNYPSGFGPYSQERLCRETGGSFFVLQQPASIKGFNTRRLALVGYESDLISRREAEEVTARSRFRTACDTIIRTLNPGTDPQLNLRESHFSVDPDEFFTQAVGEFEKAGHAWAKLSKAIEELEEVRNLREAEPSKRWRANYDLLYAQCRAYRVRLFQYMLVLDAHAAKTPEPGDPKQNRWRIRAINTEIASPSEDEFERLQKHLRLTESRTEFMDRLVEERTAARRAIQFVITTHVGTPWSTVAKYEKGRHFGLSLTSYFLDPRYREIGKRIKVPAL